MREFQASVHHLRAPDPIVAANRVQQEIGADVATDAPTAEALVRARVEAGRAALGGDPDADAAIRARREAILAAAAVPPPISEADVVELRRLAEDLGRAARIRQRTETRFAEVLTARVAASTGLALHPTAVRDAAEAVMEAERVLDAAGAALESLGPDPAHRPNGVTPAAGPGVEPVALEDLAYVPDPVLQRPQDDFDEKGLERQRSRRRSVAVLALGIGAALILVGAGASTAVAVGVVAAAVVLAVVEQIRARRVRRGLERDESTYTMARLESVTAAVAATDSGRAAAALSGPDPREVWLARRVELDAHRDEAEERLLVAQKRWHQLAGPNAEPGDVESIVAAHDPQMAFTGALADTSPTVRTVAAFHRKAQARWKVIWATLGREQAPEPERLDDVLARMLGAHRQAVSDARALADADARLGAAEAVQRPIVLTAPSEWLGPDQLERLLASVPPEGRVVVIEALDGDAEIEA